MTAEPKPKSTSAARMRAHRARMRARGLKPRTIWTFDEKDAAFVRLAQEQFASLKDRPDEIETHDWIDAGYPELPPYEPS